MRDPKTRSWQEQWTWTHFSVGDHRRVWGCQRCACQSQVLSQVHAREWFRRDAWRHCSDTAVTRLRWLEDMGAYRMLDNIENVAGTAPPNVLFHKLKDLTHEHGTRGRTSNGNGSRP